MPTLAVSNLTRCVASLRPLLGELTTDEWRTPSLCPGWDVHAVVSHLVVAEELLSGWRPQGATPAPFDRLVPAMSEAALWTAGELLDRFDQAISGRLAELNAMSPPDFAATSWTPAGVSTYEGFLEVRVFDFYVHEQDIRVPLGHRGHLEGPAAEMALSVVRRAFGYIAAKRAGLPDGTRVTVHVNGPVIADVSAIVEDGRGRSVDDLAAPDVEVTTDFLTFMLLACGRLRAGRARADRLLVCGGDEGLAGQLVANLAFTI